MDNINKKVWSFKDNDGAKKDTILSVLIPSLKERNELLNILYETLKKQIIECEQNVEIIVLIDNREISIGAKRNHLMEMAKGEYVCYFDDDDMPSANYINFILKALKSKPDVVCFNGDITMQGSNPMEWRLGLGLSRVTNYYMGRPESFDAPPNHIAVMKKELVKNYKFLEINFGEDCDWADRIAKDNILKTEVKINEKIYHYVFSK